jgi:aminoglycoside phosphotransferase family enzyme/predicted kinase
MGSLKDDLLQPSAYARPPRRIDFAETHISWVFLVDDEVYKVKRPVSLGFLDFRSPDLRKRACEAEVVLNSRLATGVYRGVVPVRRDARGTHRIDGAGHTVDWAVHMRRLPDDRRADALLGRRELTLDRIDSLAERLASFHRSARCDRETARFGTVSVIAENVRENFAQTRASSERFIAASECREIERAQTDFLREHSNLFEARIQAQKIRDGHGDLRLEHVYFLDTGITILDRIEFNERFRYVDVCADIAFLSMDLAWNGRLDLAERLLARYAREADDYDLYALVDFYEGYRAYVRAKVSAFRALDENAEAPLRAHAEADARRFFLLALSATRRPLLPPMLVCVGGLIGAGKSTMADQVGRALDAPIVDTDRTRKHLMGIAPEEVVGDEAWQGGYAPVVTERVYDEVLRRAGVVLASGRSVVLDASFRSRASRLRARALARSYDVPFLFVECRAAPRIILSRLEQREGTRGVSDARARLFDDFSARFEPIEELKPDEHLPLDTSRPVEENATLLKQHLAAWPRK